MRKAFQSATFFALVARSLICKSTICLSLICILPISVSLIATSSAAAHTQSETAAPPAAAVTNDALAPGTVLAVELSKSLDAKKSKANDKIEAKTAVDLLVRGKIVVPRNTKIIGHVTEAKAHSKSSPGSVIGVTFDRMLLKGGREVSLQLTVQAIARPLQVPGFGSGPDNLADVPSMPGRLPPVGAQAPATGSSSTTLTPKYPDDMAPPPSINTGGPSPSTIIPLSASSRGVVGMKGLSMDTSGPVSVLTSSTGNVHLDSGTQLALRVQ